MSVAPLQLLKSEFNPLVYVALDNATDKLVSGAYFYGTTGTTPSDAYFTKGALLVQATDGTLYQNSADDGDTPSWGLVGGGGGVAIGDAITDADAGSILYVDGTGNLTQDTGFTRTSTGVTNISSTFGSSTGQFSISDNLFGVGVKGIGTKFSVDSNNYTEVVYDVGGGPRKVFELLYSDTSKSEIILEPGGNVSLSAKGTTLDVSRIRLYNNSSSVFTTISGIDYGFRSEAGVVTIGKISGGSSTKITIDDLNQQITITNVPTYANDAAAITGGLTTGMLYKTTTGGITALNIVP